MKRSGKVFLWTLCIILLFAYSYASDMRAQIEAKNQKVTLKWSPVEKYANDKDIRKEDGEVKYVDMSIKQTIKMKIRRYRRRKSIRQGLGKNLQLRSKKQVVKYPSMTKTKVTIFFLAFKPFFTKTLVKLENLLLSQVRFHGRAANLAPAINHSMCMFQNSVQKI
jgi:hypothetical protein